MISGPAGTLRHTPAPGHKPFAALHQGKNKRSVI
jgi:hypothetical protein